MFDLILNNTINYIHELNIKYNLFYRSVGINEMYNEIQQSINRSIQKTFKENITYNLTIDNKCINYPENKVKEPHVKTNIQPSTRE